MGNRRVIVTGINGFLGSAIARAFQQEKWQVLGLVRQQPAEPVGNVEYLEIRTAMDVIDRMAQARPDLVIHLAALYRADHDANHVADLIESNLSFGTFVLEAMRAAGVKQFLWAGSYGQNHAGRQGIGANLYAALKNAYASVVDYYADADMMRAACLVIPDTFGARDPRGKLLTILKRALQTGEKLQLSPGEQKLDFVHRDDVARAFVQACAEHENLAPGTHAAWQISSGRLMSLRDLARIAEVCTGRRLNAEWGARAYRRRENMQPSIGPLLPNWQPVHSIEDWFSSSDF